MLSIESVLTAYNSRLPSTWSPKDGLRKLFPPNFSDSISLLTYYVIFVYRQLATQGYGEDSEGQSYIGPSCIGDFWLGADGNGNWFFGWIYGDSDTNYEPREAGFVFKFSPDENGRGYLDSSHPPLYTLSCSAGNDPVIKNNWVEMFVGGGRMSFQAPPENLNPANFWTKEGFTGLTPLSGSHVSPAAGVPSGSSLFPFPSSVPASALDPPGANLFTPMQYGGGPAGPPSSSTFDTVDYPNNPDDIGGISWGPSLPDGDE